MRVIEDIQNLSVAELLNTLRTERELELNTIDFINHIKKNTNGFDKFFVKKLDEQLNGYLRENLPIILNLERAKEIIADNNQYGINAGITGQIVRYIENNSKLLDVYTDTAFEISDFIRWATLIGMCEVLDLGFYNIFEYIYALEEVKYHIGLTKDKPPKKDFCKMQNHPQTFEELFRAEYRTKIPKFTNTLKQHDLITEDGVWGNSPYSELGRIFNYLDEIRVLAKGSYEHRAVLFCKHFGIDVYKEGADKTTDNATSLSNLRKSRIDSLDNNLSVDIYNCFQI